MLWFLYSQTISSLVLFANDNEVVLAGRNLRSSFANGEKAGKGWAKLSLRPLKTSDLGFETNQSQLLMKLKGALV